MSRLDYVTIAIVAVCVAALVYLIYMTTNLLGESNDPGNLTENTTTPSDNEDTGDDTYYFDDEGRIEDSGTEADAGSNTTSNDGSDYDYQNGEDLDKGGSTSTPTATPNEMDTEDSGVAEEEFTARGGSSTSTKTAPTRVSSGEPYMVIAGTFSNKANAEGMSDKLRSMGYSNVALEPFDRGKYTAVLVERFNALSEAQSLVRELKNKGQEAYVKKK